MKIIPILLSIVLLIAGCGPCNDMTEVLVEKKVFGKNSFSIDSTDGFFAISKDLAQQKIKFMVEFENPTIEEVCITTILSYPDWETHRYCQNMKDDPTPPGVIIPLSHLGNVDNSTYDRMLESTNFKVTFKQSCS